MSARNDRRRAQEAEYAAMTRDTRPNIPPAPIPEEARCPSRVGGRHNFSSIHRDDPRGSGLTSVRCWYCSRRSPTSQARVDAWQQETP